MEATPTKAIWTKRYLGSKGYKGFDYVETPEFATKDELVAYCRENGIEGMYVQTRMVTQFIAKTEAEIAGDEQHAAYYRALAEAKANR